jgi:hypothetical protein
VFDQLTCRSGRLGKLLYGVPISSRARQPSTRTATCARSTRSRKTRARTVLTGHGDPWTGGIEAAVAHAHAAGVA